MKILKFFLYVVLALCVLWGLIVSAGGKILTSTVNFYYGDHLTLEQVSVSPRLDVSIGRINFNFPVSGEKRELISGYSRAVNVSWSVSAGSPSLAIKSGTTVIYNGGEFKSASFDILFKDGFQSADLSAVLNELKIMSVFVEHIDITGNLFFDGFLLTDIYFQAQTLTSPNNFDLKTAQLNGEISRYELFAPLANQIYSSEFDARRIAAAGFFAHSGRLLLVNDFGNAQINLTLEGVNDHGKNVSIKSARYDTLLTLSNINVWDSNFILEEVFFSKLGLSLNKINGKLEEEGTSQNISADGVLVNSNIVINGGYLGQIENGSIGVDLKSTRSSSSTHLVGLVDLKIFSNPDVTGDAEIDLWFDPSIIMKDCVLFPCFEKNSIGEFRLNVEGHSIAGNLSCKKKKCKISDLLFSAETSDTQKFFEAASRANIINALHMAYIYSQFLMGEPNKKGHKFILN